MIRRGLLQIILKSNSDILFGPESIPEPLFARNPMWQKDWTQNYGDTVKLTYLHSWEWFIIINVTKGHFNI